MNAKFTRKISEINNKGFRKDKKVINKAIRLARNKGEFKVSFYVRDFTCVDAIITHYKNKKYIVETKGLYEDGRENDPIFKIIICW